MDGCIDFHTIHVYDRYNLYYIINIYTWQYMAEMLHLTDAHSDENKVDVKVGDMLIN